MIRNSAERYGAVAQLLHWLVMLLVVVQFVLGNLAESAGERGGPAGMMDQLVLLTRHKSIGITIGVLVLIRLSWRVFSPAPSFPTAMGAIERTLAKATHYGFYVLLLLMPISGWLMSSAANFPVSYFGLFTLPNMVSPDDALKELLQELHHLAATVLLSLVLVHVAAALKHHLWDRDDVLLRMLPIAKLRKEQAR